MNSNFQYAPGLPGYGTGGKNGIDGSTGLSMYFTNLNGVDDHITIKNKILSNTVLWSTTTLANNRKYQTGDTFVDKQGRVYEIRLSTLYPDRYISTGSYLNTSNLFAFLDITNDVGVLRYYNQYIGTRYAIDSVFSTAVIDYTSHPINIYGIKPVNFERIEFSDIAPQSKNYNPFTLFTSGGTGTDYTKSIALVRDNINNKFRLGNLDTDGSIRNVDLVFDVHDLIVNRDKTNYFTTLTETGNVLSNYEMKINNLVDPIFKRDVSSWKIIEGVNSDVSICWNLLDITGTNNMASIAADLYIYQDIPITKSTFDMASTIINPSTMIFRDIDSSGAIELTGLAVGNTYHTYIKVIQNGWERETRRIEFDPTISQLDISLGFGLPQKLNATALTIYKDGSICDLDVSSNKTVNITTDVPSWLHISKTSLSIIDVNSSTWLVPHDSSIKIDAYTTPDSWRYGTVSVIGGALTKTISVSQSGPLSPTADVSVNADWSVHHAFDGDGFIGYATIEKSDGAGGWIDTGFNCVYTTTLTDGPLAGSIFKLTYALGSSTLYRINPQNILTYVETDTLGTRTQDWTLEGVPAGSGSTCEFYVSGSPVTIEVAFSTSY